MKEKYEKGFKGVWFDPRTKIVLLLTCVLAAATAPNLEYELGLVVMIAIYALLCGSTRMAITGAGVYLIFYLLTQLTISHASPSVQAILLAFFGLFHKVYPCGMIGGVIIGSTKISEFLSAMNKVHAPKTFSIPFAIMLRYIPTIREDWHYIKDAMRLRDVSPTFLGLVKKPAMTLECVYVPLMMAASKASDELSIASVTRGIENPASRTCYQEIKFGIADVIVAVGFLAYFLAGFFL